MKHPIGTRVKVTKMIDETGNDEFLNKEGTVTGHNANGMSGNTEADPLHEVTFDDMPEEAQSESFWYEEIQALKQWNADV